MYRLKKYLFYCCLKTKLFWTNQNKFPSTWKKTDLFDLKRIQTVLTGIDKAKKQKIVLLKAPTVWLKATHKQSLEEHIIYDPT